MIACFQQRTVHGSLYEYSPAQYLTSIVSWTTKQQALKDEPLVTAVSLLKVEFKAPGAVGNVIRLIEVTSCAGKAPDGAMIL